MNKSQDVASPGYLIDEAVKAKVDAEQAEVERFGLRPHYARGASQTSNYEFKGIVNLKGDMVLPCKEFSAVGHFHNGRAFACSRDNKKWGFIDRYGSEVIACQWKKVNLFKNGLAKVSDSKNFLLQDKWVYIDKTGRVVM